MGMLFEGRYKKARALQKERAEQAFGRAEDEITSPSDVMEKGDLPAMILAAFLTILPIGLLVIAVLAVCGYCFIVR